MRGPAFLYTGFMSPRLSALFLAALLAAPSRAQYATAPAAAAPDDAAQAEQARVDPGALHVESENLRDAIMDPKVSASGAKELARSFFDRVNAVGTPVAVLPRTERERVTGELGSIEGFQRTAEARLEEWRKRTREVPPPELSQAVELARRMNDGEKLDFEGGMAENQMGVFRYMKDRYDGIIRLNDRLQLLAAIIGPAFAYATVAHESAHARDRAAGKLGDESEIDGEIRAFKTQYLWLMLMDPIGERLMVLRSTVALSLRRRRDPVKELALKYLDHLVSVRETAGDERSLRKLVEALGYGNDGHNRQPGKPSSAARL